MATTSVAAKKPLDHDVYDSWNSIQRVGVSDDGRWVMYTLTPGWGDSTLVLVSAEGAVEHRVPRGSQGVFAADSRHAIVRVEASKEEVRQATIDKVEKEQHPRPSMAIVELGTGQITTIENVTSFKVPDRELSYLLYHLGTPQDDESEDETSGEEEEQATSGEEVAKEPAPAPLEPASEPEARHVRTEKEPAPEPEPAHEPEPEPESKPVAEPEGEASESDEADDKKKEKKAGTRLVLLDLGSGVETVIENATSYELSERGELVGVTLSTEDGAGDGVLALRVSLDDEAITVEQRTVFEGEGELASLAVARTGSVLGFLSNRDEYDEEEPRYVLYAWEEDDEEARQIIAPGHEVLPRDWIVSEHASLTLSENTRRLYFGIAPPPIEEPEEEIPSDEQVHVDVWHYRDLEIQPYQLENVEDERKRSYLAVAHLDEDDTIVRLGDERFRDVTVGETGDDRYVVRATTIPYRRMLSHDTQMYSDISIVDVRTGETRLTHQRVRAWGGVRLSPGGGYAYWFDLEAQQWYTLSLRSGESRAVSEGVETSLVNELHDAPSLPGAYGVAGWVGDDEAMLIYDRFDIWAADPDGFWSPRCVTDGVGRDEGIRFRVIDTDPDEPALDPDEPLLLSAFVETTKESGFYQDAIEGNDDPKRLVRGPKRWRYVGKARDARTVVVTREDFIEFPDLLATDLRFETFDRLSDANPQQEEYLWGTAELVEWVSNDGEALQGIVYKPEDFDPSRQYPMMTYFYERNSHTLHNHIIPAPHRSIINHSFYASRGYVIFVPDIPYIEGYPGDSAMNAVMPGVLKMLETGYIDRERLGIQGHSWGGYQIAYMITQTDLFTCAEAGAPVANMTSAYGGIRWGSGMSRQFQYEKTQSRIGGTLWDAQQTYIENSPLFWANRVNTPLLIMHNDEDGAVPWEQGIELFMALRRLGKPVWMINYNGQPHWPNTWHTRSDWARRLQQYFDHYLMDAPAPVWLRDGVPAVRKGTTFGFELTDSDEPIDLPLEHAPEPSSDEGR
ncbi:MAG: alpha/beta hydrolase family protein [Phycisphaerales bacterium JB043]